MLYAVVRAIVAAVCRALFRLEVRGAEHVPRAAPLLIVANHSSVLDPPIVAVAAPRPLHFMAKAELFGIPLLGRLIRTVNALPVRREGSDPRALREALKILRAGQALLVFPEGTRGAEGALREGKAGAGMLALLGGVPVIPAYIEGTGRALPRGRSLPRPVKVRVTFGPPLRLGQSDGRPDKQHYQEASRRMMAAIGRLKDASREAVTGAGVSRASG